MHSKVLIQGGLGNQMFQMAFVYVKKQNENKVDVVCAKKIKVKKYFYYSPFYTNNWIYGLLISLTRKLNPNKYKKYFSDIRRIDDFGSVEIIRQNINTQSTFEGTFCSIFYFEKYQDEIKNLFTVKNEFINSYNSLIGFKQNQHKSIVLHIRRTDYQNWGGNDLSLPLKYYINCLNKIPDISDFKLYIIGDDIIGLDKEFRFLDFEILHFHEIVDFQILMNADIIIGANSTFSWWAAYLNKKVKKVYFPKYWLGLHVGKTMPEIIFYGKPDHWELIE